MEEQIIFYFALATGILLFASLISFGSEVGDVALEGEALVLIKNLQDAAQQVVASPEGYYAEMNFLLPERLATKEFTINFLTGSVTITVDSRNFTGSINVSNSEKADGGDLLQFYRRENSKKVFVRRLVNN